MEYNGEEIVERHDRPYPEVGGARHREEEFDLNWKYYLNSVDSLKKRHLNKKCHLYDQHPSKASNKNADGHIAMFHRLCKGIL